MWKLREVNSPKVDITIPNKYIVNHFQVPNEPKMLKSPKNGRHGLWMSMCVCVIPNQKIIWLYLEKKPWFRIDLRAS